MKKHLFTLAAALSGLLLFSGVAAADTVSVNFENPPYTVGSINGQDGWTSTGAYDQGVVSNPVISGAQSFRISNSVTSGSFGDQTFSKPLTDSAGETGSDPSGFPQGTLQPHFESQFTIKAIPESVGDIMSVSPDTGNGGRMSYLRFDNEADGIHVYFDDVQGTTKPATFVETELTPALSSATTHTIKFSIDFVNGPSNDVVNIYIDGVLVHTGTSWENYYRFDSESNPTLVNTFTHSVRSMLFRAGGTAVPANSGKGFLIDDLSLLSGPTPVAHVHVTIAKYIDGVHATTVNANGESFSQQATYNFTNEAFPTGISGSDPYSIGPVGNNTATAYEAQTLDFFPGASYSTSENMGSNVGASCSDGKEFALAGYSSGADEAAAAAASMTMTAPSFPNLQSNEFVIVHNTKCVAAPISPQVHIFKYVNGVQATATNANNAVFPMLTSWVSSGPNGTVNDAPFTLSPTGWGAIDAPYEASYVGGVAGDNYTAHEVTGGSVVGASCSDGKAFALAGYSSGDTLSAAFTNASSTVAPAFTNLQSDKYMIVWNKTCAAVTPPSQVPTDKNQCMNNGWKTLKDTAGHSFKNQGDCVSFVATKGKNVAAGN